MRKRKKKKIKSNQKRRKHSSRDWSRAETIKTHKSAAKKVAPNQTKNWSNSRRLKMLWALERLGQVVVLKSPRKKQKDTHGI